MGVTSLPVPVVSLVMRADWDETEFYKKDKKKVGKSNIWC